MTVTRASAEYAEPHADEVAIIVPQILTQMVDRTVEVRSLRSWNAQCLCPKRRCRM